MTTRADMPAAIEAAGFWRRSRGTFPGAGVHKEWFHFVVRSGDVTALINFSVCDVPALERGTRSDSGQLICLVHANRWYGSLETFERPTIQARRGGLAMDLAGENSVVFEDGVFKVRARPKSGEIEIDLRLTPLAYPTPSDNVVFDDCPPLAWLAIPRLTATGWMRLGAGTYIIDDAPAYHDHNWGEFRWGGDFVWEWGFAVPSLRANPFSVVFTRFMVRSRTSDLARGLLVWRDAWPVRIFRDSEVEVRSEGFLGATHITRLPAAMGIFSCGTATDVAKRLHVSARRSRDWLDMSFEAFDLAQIVIPNDADLGVMRINEVLGEVSIAGVIAGEPVSLHETTTFEFMSD